MKIYFKLLVFFIAVALLFAASYFVFLRGGEEDTWICKDGIWIKHGNPSSPRPLDVCPRDGDADFVEKNSDKKLIGGERDEHGCLTPAGYSWCDSKQECIRNWEEICPPSSR